MIVNSIHSNELVSPARTVAGRVELFEGSTLLNTFNHTDALSSFTLSRAGDKKFFGFGVCQEIEVKLVDKERIINIEKEQILKVSFGVGEEFVYPAPLFYVADVARDENTNELTIKAYDAIHKAKNYTFADLGLEAPYTPIDVLTAALAKIGVRRGSAVRIKNLQALKVSFPEGANFEGTETLREVLDAIAEACQCIYYLNLYNDFILKTLVIDGEPDLIIDKSNYFTLESKESRTLSDICSATELGDNVIISAPGITGETQYVRDNPFWELRDDITTVLEEAIAVVGGLTLHQFNCKWRGNYLVEPGDKIGIVTKDNNVITSYLLDEKYTYNGGFSADTAWEYGEKNGESVDNPVTLGDALKKTYAKVDKANAEIEIVAGETAAIKLTAENVTTSVTKLDEDMTNLVSQVSTKVSADEVNFSIQTALGEGVERVTTATGFTFNEEGLHISKEDSEITTSITEDGMTVYRKNDEVLTVDNLGVTAEDLHATTFLIIGENSRLEDYGSRTGCFWIGN